MVKRMWTNNSESQDLFGNLYTMKTARERFCWNFNATCHKNISSSNSSGEFVIEDNGKCSFCECAVGQTFISYLHGCRNMSSVRDAFMASELGFDFNLFEIYLFAFF